MVCYGATSSFVHTISIDLPAYFDTYNGNGIVDVAVGEEVCAHRLLLDFAAQHLPHAVSVVKQVPNLQMNNTK